MAKRLIIYLLFFFAHTLHAQTLMNKDSLLKLLPSAKNDSNTVLLYINIGQQYEGSEPEKAKQYYLKARDLSEQIHFVSGTIKYISNFTYLLNMQGLYDSSLALNLQAVALSRQINDSLLLGKTLFNAGSSYRAAADFESAVKFYEEGKNILFALGNTAIEAQGSDILQLLFYDLKQYQRGVEYGERAVAGLRKTDDIVSLGMALTNLGINYSQLKNYAKSSVLFKEALAISYRVGDKNMEQTVYLNLSDVALQESRYEDLKTYTEKALKLAIEIDSRESQLIALKSLSFYYAYKRNYPLAKKYANDALAISYANDFKVQRAKVFSQLSNIAFAEQDSRLGEYYATQSGMLGDSLLNETVQKNIVDIEKKYETTKKENRIRQLEDEKKIQQLAIRQKNMVNYVLAASAVVILLLSVLFYRNYRQKQKLQQQRITELETQQQLTATEAVLKGEEQERTRLAKDLHDGLGGMLSGIKYSFNTMKGNLVMTPDNANAFERSMDMLDSSIAEMRRVAHNMMPEALVKFGLDTALRDFCNDINQSGALKVAYQSIGLENATIDQTISIAIYRVVQELLNNTMKHAAARNAVVQVTKENNQVAVTVEDDGKGFDTRVLQQSKGIGWNNIQHRVDFLKGKLDVQSDSDKGTSVHIEFNV